MNWIFLHCFFTARGNAPCVFREFFVRTSKNVSFLFSNSIRFKPKKNKLYSFSKNLRCCVQEIPCLFRQTMIPLFRYFSLFCISTRIWYNFGNFSKREKRLSLYQRVKKIIFKTSLLKLFKKNLPLLY